MSSKYNLFRFIITDLHDLNLGVDLGFLLETNLEIFPLGKGQVTPPKTNMEPKNRWFVDVSPFPRVSFQVLCQFSRG